MNERINILAEQAGLHCDGTPDCWDQEAIARFSQLIVRECMEACSRANEIRHFVPPTQKQVVLSCMREIETTFWS